MSKPTFTHTFDRPFLSYLDDDFRFEADLLDGIWFRAVSRRAKRWLKRNPPPGGWRVEPGYRSAKPRIRIDRSEANDLGSQMREAGFQIADPYGNRFGPY